MNFDKDLKVFYLSSLAEKDYEDAFLKFYHSVENYLEELVAKSDDLEVLNRVKGIIAYRTKLLEKRI